MDVSFGGAYGENTGWIVFNCSNTNSCATVDYKLKTDWRPSTQTELCTSWSYSDWSTCSNNQQSRTVISSSPASCSGGTPTLTQNCSTSSGGFPIGYNIPPITPTKGWAVTNKNNQNIPILKKPINKFTKHLKFGQTNSDIKRLQIFLNQSPDTKLTDTGGGSPNNETEFFGNLTLRAIIKFQEKYAKEILSPWGLSRGTGLVGKTTLKKINQLLN